MRPFRVGVILCVCSTAMLAQDFPKAEIYGGYSYASMPVLSKRANANGWDASATVNLYKAFCLARRSRIARGGSCHLRTC